MCVWTDTGPPSEEEYNAIYAGMLHDKDDSLAVALAKHIALLDKGLLEIYTSDPVRERRKRQATTKGVRACLDGLNGHLARPSNDSGSPP